MRIAQLANFVGPTSGGMKVAIEELGKGYVAAGHERILVIPGKRDKVTETENGTIVEVGSPRINRTYRVIAKPWKALSVVKKFKPDTVECSDKWTLSPVGYWAKRNGIGSVLLSHERLDDMVAGWLRAQTGVEAVVGALNRILAKEFDLVVVTSDYSAREHEGTGAELRKVSLGVDLETFNPSTGQPPTSGPVQLCYVGRMSHEKNPELAVAAAQELHRRNVDFELNMYGTGVDEAKLKRQAEGAPVKFHGFVSGRSDVSACFARSHISLSVCPTETFGLSVLEALASGTPVVTSDRGGARELVDESCGEWGSPSEIGIADAVERMIDRLDKEPLREAARKRAEQFSWEKSVAGMLAVHQEAIERGAK